MTSKQICERTEVLNDLTNQNSVTLTWVPVHAGIQGNERADQLAKQASHELYIGPEPALPVSHMAVKSAIRPWTYKKAQARWQSNNDCRQAKMMINTSSPSYPNELPDKSTSNDASACCRSDVGTCLSEPTSKYNEGCK